MWVSCGIEIILKFDDVQLHQPVKDPFQLTAGAWCTCQLDTKSAKTKKLLSLEVKKRCEIFISLISLEKKRMQI
jgi:hypothetical protein